MKTVTKKNLRALFEPILSTSQKDKYLPQTEWTQVDYENGVVVLSKSNGKDTYLATTLITNNKIQPQHFFIKDYDIKEMLKTLGNEGVYKIVVSSFAVVIQADAYEYTLPAVTDFFDKVIVSKERFSAEGIWNVHSEFARGSSDGFFYLNKNLANKLKAIRELREISDKDLPIYLSPSGARYWSDDTEAFILTEGVDDTFHRLNKCVTDALIKFNSLTTSDIKIEINKFYEYGNEAGISVFDCFGDGILFSSVSYVTVLDMKKPSYNIDEDVEVKPMIDELKSYGINSRTSTKTFNLTDFNNNEHKVRGGDLFALLNNFPFKTMTHYNCFRVFSMSQKENKEIAYFKHTFKEYDG